MPEVIAVWTETGANALPSQCGLCLLWGPRLGRLLGECFVFFSSSQRVMWEFYVAIRAPLIQAEPMEETEARSSVSIGRGQLQQQKESTALVQKTKDSDPSSKQ